MLSLTPGTGGAPGRMLRMAVGAAIVASGCIGVVSETQNAVANGDTRTLSLYYVHTKERITVTFKRSGVYDRAALKQLNWFLRDWRREEPTRMDPRLFDLVWEVYRELGSRETIHVLSAYRAPATNAMLRRRSGRVAEHSQHMLGKALDFYLPDVPSSRVREVGVRLQRGGVGYYPSSYNPFVHLDVGSVRAWPRLSHAQLSRIFPDGKTVHIPANGRPLARYNEARAEILARGGAVAGSTAYAVAEATPKKGFWARLFGGSDESEDVAEQQAIASAPAYRPRSAREAAATARQVAWAKGDETRGDAGLLGFIGGGQQPQAPAPAEPATASRLPPMEAPQTRIAALPSAIAPLPAERPQELAAAANAPAEGHSAGAAQFAVAPLPPRRPDTAGSSMLTAALGGDDSALRPSLAPADAQAVALAMAPLPPSRPQDIGGAAAPASATAGAAPATAVALAPLPPARPASLHAADANALSAITAGLRPPPPAGALAYAASPETTSALSPLPPQRPAELGLAAAPQRTPGAGRSASRGREPAPGAARNGGATASASAPVSLLPDRIARVYESATFSDANPADPSGAALAAALLGLKDHGAH